MRIQLQNWNISDLKFHTKETESEIESNTFDLKTGNFFNEEDLKLFGVAFEIELRDSHFDLSIDASFMFELDEEIDEEFKVSDFPKVNAPAIAFPYLRTFISNFTLNAGYKPIILPSINFVKMARDEANSENSSQAL